MKWPSLSPLPSLPPLSRWLVCPDIDRKEGIPRREKKFRSWNLTASAPARSLLQIAREKKEAFFIQTLEDRPGDMWESESLVYFIFSLAEIRIFRDEGWRGGMSYCFYRAVPSGKLVCMARFGREKGGGDRECATGSKMKFERKLKI